MKVDGDVRPEAIWVRCVEGEGAHVRLRRNIVEALRTSEDGSSRTAYEYDEVEVLIREEDPVGVAAQRFEELFAQGLAREHAQGKVVVPAGQGVIRIAHGLGAAPRRVEIAGAEGLRVLTLSADYIEVMLPGMEAADLELSWLAGLEDGHD